MDNNVLNLLDNYEKVGNDLEEFIAETKNLDDMTEYVKVPKNMIEILSCEAALPEGQGYRVLKLNKETIDQFEGEEHVFKKHIRLFAPGSTPELDESMKNLGFVIMDALHNRCMCVSALAATSLANKTNMSPAALDGASLVRDAFIARQLAKSKEKNLLLCTRKGEGVTKVFAFLSRYNPQPLSVLGDIANDLINTDTLGKPEVKSWRVNHDICQIMVEFPEAAEDFKETYKLKSASVPGVLLQTSGIGTCSLSAYSTSRQEKATWPVILESVKRRHTSELATENIIKDISDTILSRMTKLPERLADLMAIPIGVLPASDSEARKNKREVLKTYKYVIKKTSLKRNELLGKERAEKLINKLEAQINPYAMYTAYDIADTFLNLPDDPIFSDFKSTRRLQLQQACGAAPFVTFRQESIEEEMDFGGEDE